MLFSLVDERIALAEERVGALAAGAGDFLADERCRLRRMRCAVLGRRRALVAGVLPGRAA